MLKRTALVLVVTLCSGTVLLADFSYQQTSKLTGGMMAGMMKVAGVFSKKARDPIITSVLVKGDRMANVMPGSAQIIDLGKETITQIDYEKKTYSVLTFAQFAEVLAKMNSQVRDDRGNEVTDLTVKASVKQTGQTRSVGGMDTHEAILTLEMEGTDKKTGQKQLAMTMTSEMWLGPAAAGYDEVRDFYKRLAEKLGWAPGLGAMAPPGSSKGMAEMMKEMSKLDGMPVLQVMRIGGGLPPGADGQQAAAQQQQQQPPQQQVEEEKPSAGGALAKLAGGRFGGLGGFGRKKKNDDAQQQQASSPAPAQQSQPSGQQGPPSLMEMTSELSGFSAAAVDGSKFEVPAGFKQVESEMLKNSRR